MPWEHDDFDADAVPVLLRDGNGGGQQESTICMHTTVQGHSVPSNRHTNSRVWAVSKSSERGAVLLEAEEKSDKSCDELSR